MECILERYTVKDMLHGDIYIYNDPYVSRGGVTHTPDMVFAAPVFADGGALVGFSVCWAHHTDIGGLAAGTLSPLATEVFHEGLLLPPVRLCRAEVVDDGLMRVILNNSRFPDTLHGDMRALIASCRLGQARLSEIVKDFGSPCWVSLHHGGPTVSPAVSSPCCT
jgi:N-methylhydantoinase B